MDLSAATATAEMPWLAWLVLVVLASGFLASYPIRCAWWPWTKCRKCEGKGRFMSPSGKNWRDCPRCKGGGRRVRLGRRFYNWLSVTKEDAK